jgi:hypothetical protein
MQERLMADHVTPRALFVISAMTVTMTMAVLVVVTTMMMTTSHAGRMVSGRNAASLGMVGVTRIIVTSTGRITNHEDANNHPSYASRRSGTR